ncbi:uncharacterized protein SPSK_00240 [Sporothrix schenckii 1099-18]|uniref:Biogenesis of lysosome-related organelles complex 1 subunit 1 n=1 Tax=Sporothrix schenckii 1099-18 TaxID=1397361 RepID=A0A0F2M5F5_SPOSC|nr:uncharacterized protein SPSK_00240 [Sporothrix schenckii 1099-18]KJR84010.1 hypothetical protein SPSK_00240 [Sporothrix schenckii 1099-18]
MTEPASASTPAPASPPASGGAASHSLSTLPPLLSRLSLPRAAPASLSAVNAVSVPGNSSGAPATSAVASLATRDESMLRVVRRADSVSTTTAPSSSTATPSTTSTATVSAASPNAAPPSSVSSVSPVAGGPFGPLVAGPAAPLLPPATGAALAEPLAHQFPPTSRQGTGPASVATAPAALTSAPRSMQAAPPPPPPPPLQRLQPSLPSASAQRQVAEARQALDASIANLLDSQLQSRAVLMHNNMRAIEGQQRDLGKAVLGLRKANDGLAHLVHEMTGPLKEMGDMQNWTEMQFQGLSAIEETLRLVREKRERRERRERAAVEREAQRAARRAARQEAGPEAGDNGDGDVYSDGGSSDSGTYWSSSYYSGSSRSRSRSVSHSRSRSRSRQASPSRSKALDEMPLDKKGKGKAKIEDIVENVRALPSSSRRKETVPRDEQPKTSPLLTATTQDKGKGKNMEVDEVDDVANATTNTACSSQIHEAVPDAEPKEPPAPPAKSDDGNGSPAATERNETDSTQHTPESGVLKTDEASVPTADGSKESHVEASNEVRSREEQSPADEAAADAIADETKDKGQELEEVAGRPTQKTDIMEVGGDAATEANEAPTDGVSLTAPDAQSASTADAAPENTRVNDKRLAVENAPSLPEESNAEQDAHEKHVEQEEDIPRDHEQSISAVTETAQLKVTEESMASETLSVTDDATI